jgi:hypothetical protein
MKDGYFIMRIEDGISLLREAIYSDNALRKRLEDFLKEI